MLKPAAEEKLSARLFAMDSRIRYVALNQKGQIVEMEQSPSHPSYNMNGIRYVVIRYGTQYQLLMPYRDGHVSVGVELQDDPVEIAGKVAAAIGMTL